MNRLGRLTPLTGLLFAALDIVAIAAVPKPLSANATRGHTVAFFTVHRAAERAGDAIGRNGEPE